MSELDAGLWMIFLSLTSLSSTGVAAHPAVEGSHTAIDRWGGGETASSHPRGKTVHSASLRERTTRVSLICKQYILALHNDT